jgi:8-oxo-dGTP diphosphatase
MSEPLQFGQRRPGLDYRRRRAAFGIVVRDGLIACVRVDRGPASYFDLPGGAVDGEETEEAAVAREFSEESGLQVEAAKVIVRAAQYFLKSDGQPVNNLGGIYVARLLGEDPAAKCEDDHTLVWLDPDRCVRELRHDAHAWAVAAWLRGGS